MLFHLNPFGPFSFFHVLRRLYKCSFSKSDGIECWFLQFFLSFFVSFFRYYLLVVCRTWACLLSLGSSKSFENISPPRMKIALHKNN